jgi:DNA-directed RNA polymerase subunit F
MSNESAKIVSLADLMSDNIGDNQAQVEKEVSSKDLTAALNNEGPDFNFFNLSDAKRAQSSSEESEEIDNDDSDEPAGRPQIQTLVDSPEIKSNTEETLKFTSNNSEVYKKTLKSMFGDSISSLIQEDEEGNEIEVALDDLDLDDELFNQILQSKLDEIKEEATKDKISVAGVSDFTRDLIEIDRNGGDIAELIKVKESYSDPLDRLDLTTEQGQIQAIYLRMLAGGQDEDTIRRLINSYKSEGVLEEIASKAEKELRGAMQQQVEHAKQVAAENAEKRKNLLKSYKKDIKENLSDFELNENVKNKIVSLATKEDDHGRFEIDRIYYSHREDPRKAARLALFLLDEQEYINQVTREAVRSTKLNTAKKLKIVTGSSKSNSGPVIKDNVNKFGGDGLIPLETIAGAK